MDSRNDQISFRLNGFSDPGENGTAAATALEISPVSKSHARDDMRAVGQPVRDSEGDQIKPAAKRAAKGLLMARLRKAKQVLVVRSYAELHRIVNAFADQHFKLVILIGNPGLGKSRLLKAVMGEGALYLHGRVTPLLLYIQAYRHRNQPIVIDDVGGLLTDPLGVAVLKDLCQTEPEKTIGWQSSTKKLEEEGVPPSFQTSSSVCIITNNWPMIDQKLPALEDRGHLIVFDPRPLDIHLAAAEWFADQEIFDFIGENLYAIPALSFRTYQQAAEFKAAGFSWQNLLIDPKKARFRRLVAQIKADPSLTSEKDRVEKFIAMGGSRATYYRHAQKLESIPPAPTVVLASIHRKAADSQPVDLVSAAFNEPQIKEQSDDE